MKQLSLYLNESIGGDNELYEMFIEHCNSHDINEGFVDWFKSIPQKLQPVIDLIKSIVETVKVNVKDLVNLFMNSKVFEFFKMIGFQLSKLYDIVKKGFDVYHTFQKQIAKYISEHKILKWSETELIKLDNWLKNNKVLMHISGIAVSAMLLYIWMNMSFIGDFSFDFDFSDIMLAIVGKFSLAKLFAGESGTRMLLLFATGMLGLSFPWPGPTSIKIAISAINGLAKIIKSKVYLQ